MIETDEDKSKFEEIYQEYRNLMYYVAYKRMQHEQDAEDVVHHVFVKIAENIKNIEPVSPKTKQLIVTIFLYPPCLRETMRHLPPNFPKFHLK